LVFEGFVIPYGVTEKIYNSSVPIYFDRIEVYVDPKRRMYAMLRKCDRVFWIELDGEVKYDNTIYFNMTMEEDYEISDLVITIEVTFKDGVTLSHGPTAKLTMSDLDVEV
jgi:hypothetical protein